MGRIVLLGGSGFIGQSLLRFLEERDLRDKYEIVIYHRVVPVYFKPDIYIEGRIEESEKIRRLIRKGDILIHLAHSTIPVDSEGGLNREIRENFVPVMKLVNVLKYRDIKGLIYFSSGGTVYGEQRVRKPISENAKLLPGSFYALCKVMIERFLEGCSEQGWINYKVVRPSNPYGPYQERLNRHGAVGKIFESIISGEEFILYGKGETVRDYIYIDDLIEGLFCIMERGKWGQVYNIGTGIGTSLKELIRLCERVSGKKLKKVYKRIRDVDLKYNVLNCRRLRGLGFKPGVGLEEGLKRTWDYFQERR